MKPMHAMNESKRDLARDEGGAIMIMGLAMILGLIAFLWFLLGIGETLAFRDHMQESADSAAFTQPAVEALCMNLIVLINLIMMVMIAIYLVWSAAVTVSWVNSVLCCPDFPASIYCCPAIFLEYYPAWNSRNSGAQKMADLDGIMSPLQSIIGMAAPWAGTGLSYLASSDYKMSSMTAAPIGFGISKMNFKVTTDLGSTTAQFGLPITHDYLGNDCSHIFEMAIDAIGGALGGDATTGITKIANKIGGLISAVVQWYYCDNSYLPDVAAMASNLTQDGTKTQTGNAGATDANGNPVNTTVTPPKFPPDGVSGGSDSNGACDDKNGTSTGGGIERLIIGGGDGGNYWNCGKYGPMMNVNHGKDENGGAKNPPSPGHSHEFKNGADETQTYSLVFITQPYSDHHAAHNIAFMQLHNSGWSQGTLTGADSKPSTYGYYAQGELFFDCDAAWVTESCNGSGPGSDVALYKFEWRARLVKIHYPGGLGKMQDFINSVLHVVSDVRSYINGHGADEIVQLLNIVDPGIVNQIGSIADPIPATLAH